MSLSIHLPPITLILRYTSTRQIPASLTAGIMSEESAPQASFTSAERIRQLNEIDQVRQL
jgi:hypothetical protein